MVRSCGKEKMRAIYQNGRESAIIHALPIQSNQRGTETRRRKVTAGERRSTQMRKYAIQTILLYYLRASAFIRGF